MKKHSSLRRVLAACLSLAMVLTLVPGAARAADSNGSSVVIEEIDASEVNADLHSHGGFKAEKADLVNTVLVNDTDRVRVTIVLPGEAAIAMVEEGMDVSDPDVVAYREQLEGMQMNAAEKISDEALDGEELDVVWNLTLAVNAISANVEYGQIEKIAKVDGVKAVYVERRYEPLSVGSAEVNNIPAQNTTGASAVKDIGYTGAGMRIAVVDTGTARWHQSFDAGAFEYSLQKQAEAKGMTLEAYKNTLNLLTEEEIASKMGQLNAAKRIGYDAEDAYLLYKNSKLPFGYNYIDNNISIDHVTGFDMETYDYEYSEHGSHVAGIAAANTYIPNPNGDGYVEAAGAVGVTGVAPDAQIITLKVFGYNGGAYTSDNFAAIEDAMVLGCDVVNLSLGSSCGFVSARGEYMIIEGDTSDIDEDDRVDAWVDGVMDRLTTNGIIMCVSAGNSGNWAEGDNYESVIEPPYCYTTSGFGMMYTDEGGTYNVGQPSTYHNTMSVASAENVGGVSQSRTTFAAEGNSVDLSIYSTTSQNNPDWATMDTHDGAGTEYDLVFLGDPSTGFDAGQMQANEDEAIFGAYDGEGAPVGSGLSLRGKVVMVSRGTSSFYQKRDAAAALGAAAVICYNHTPGDGVVSADLTGTTSKIPFGGLSFEDGKKIFDICRENDKDADGLYTCKVTVYGSLFVDLGEEGAKPTMSSFSSWGTTGAMTIKPEITTPGGSIYSVNGGVGGSGDTNEYENMSGTSMAAPHFSGLVALTQQYIRSNNNAVLKKAQAAAGSALTERQLAQSLLMSTAEPLVEYTDGEGNDILYSVRDQGAGLANVRSATSVNSFILVNGQPDGKVKMELGDGTAPWNVGFTIYNMSDAPLTYDLSAEMMTTGTEDALAAYYGWYFVTNQMVPLDADVSFSGGNRVTVPANGSVTVNATVSVSQAAIAEMRSLGYTNGFYVEGYVYASPVDTTREGIRGVTHSIPMLGWYGNWTDISMFDGDTLLNMYYPYLNGEPMYRLPHVINFYATHIVRNILMITEEGADPNDPEAADWYTGNLYEDTQYGMYSDSRYIPARNALNNDGSAWWQPTWFSPMLMRNAIAARVQVVDSQSGTVYYNKEYYEPFSGAYPNNNLGVLIPTDEYNYTPIEDYDFSNIPEGRDISISFTYAPEYYENADGSVRWDDLGKGATMSFPFRVDNTGPVLLDASRSEDGSALTITAQDNNYIAFVSVMDGSGAAWLDWPVCPDMDEEECGQAIELDFDLSYLVGNKVVVALCDYAGNERFFAVNLSETSYPGGGYGDLVAFQSGFDYNMWSEYHSWVSFDADVEMDETILFTGGVDFTSADYAGGVVYAQDSQGWLYGILYDDMANGALDLDTTRITRLTQSYVDMAYNYADGKLYALYIDEDTTTSYVDAIDLNNYQVETAVYSKEGVYGLGLACNDGGTLYLMGPSEEGDTAKLYVGTRDSAEMRAKYDLNGDQAVNVRDAQDLMSYLILGTRLANLRLADFDSDGLYTTKDVNIYLDMLDSYRPGAYQFELLFDTGLEMDYLQSMAWDHNTETLYWAHGDDNGDWDLQKIDVAKGTCTRVGALSGDTYAMFAPLTDASAAKKNHSNVAAVDPGSSGRPVLTETALCLAAGGSRRLDYNVDPWYADSQNVRWTSSDPSVATVNQSGLVTAVGGGVCTITVSNADNPNLYSTCTVTVAALDLTINGTYSGMGNNIGSISGGMMYTLTMRDGSTDMVSGNRIVARVDYGGGYSESLNTTISSAVKAGNAVWMSGGANGSGGVFHKVNPRTGVAERSFNPLAHGDTLHGLAYSDATGMFTGTYNFELYVDLPLEELVPADTWFVDFEDPNTPALWLDMMDEEGFFKSDWHCINLMEELEASDEGFGTGEAGYGAMTDVVISGITDIGSAGRVTLSRDFLGGRGASGNYVPTTTMVMLDNVGRLWYIDELMGMTDEGGSYTGTCGTVSGNVGVHACADLNGTCSVFVVREIVETPLTGMYWEGTMPRYTYHYSDIYYAGNDNNGNEVYLLSLYDYHNNGTTNQLYMLIMDGNGTLIELGDTGENNVIATIYDARVNMNSLP